MISVVIVTYNSEACVGACIDSLAASLPDAEILVVDNASTDASRAAAARHGATVVELPENVGFGRACNVGARRATREHVLFLNPDVTIRAVDAGELAKLLGTVSLGLVVPASTGQLHICRASMGSGGALADAGERCGPTSFRGGCPRVATVKRCGRPELRCSYAYRSSLGWGDSIPGTSCTSRIVISRGDIVAPAWRCGPPRHLSPSIHLADPARPAIDARSCSRTR